MTVLSPGVRPLRTARPASSRRLLLAIAVLVVGALLPSSASAAPERGVLVIEGRGGTTMTWVVREPVLLDQIPRPTFSGGGEYAGVLITPLDGAPRNGRLGAVQVRAYSDDTGNVVTPVGVDGSIEPGRYEVVLLGQGPVRASYALQSRDVPGVRLAPKAPLRVDFLGRSEPLTAGSFGKARVELPGALPAGRRAIQVALRDRSSVEDFRMCARPAGGTCEGRLLPAALPAPVPSPDAAPAPTADQSGATATALFHDRATATRGFIWSVESYYQDADDRLRTAAIVF